MGWLVVHYATMPVQSYPDPKPTPEAYALREWVRQRGETVTQYTAQAILDRAGDDMELAEVALTMYPRPGWVQEIVCQWG